MIFDVRIKNPKQGFGLGSPRSPIGILCTETEKLWTILEAGVPRYSPRGHLIYQSSPFPIVNMTRASLFSADCSLPEVCESIQA